MKRGSFDERVAKCMAQFRQVEARSSQRGERLEINRRVPPAISAAQDPEK